MFRFDLLCSLALVLGLPACSDSGVTQAATRELRYAGTVTAPAAGGTFTYRISGAWKLDTSGALISGVDSVKTLDFAIYGIQGTGLLVGKTRCVAIVGQEAWAEVEVTESSAPQVGAIGSLGVVHLVLVGGAPKGAGGPKELAYPKGSVCSDRPANLPAFDLVNGSINFPK